MSPIDFASESQRFDKNGPWQIDDLRAGQKNNAEGFRGDRRDGIAFYHDFRSGGTLSTEPCLLQFCSRRPTPRVGRGKQRFLICMPLLVRSGTSSAERRWARHHKFDGASLFSLDCRKRGLSASVKAGGRERMEVSYEVRFSQSPWPRVMRLYGQPSSRSVHRGKSGLCIELRKQLFEVADLVQSRGRQH